MMLPATGGASTMLPATGGNSSRGDMSSSPKRRAPPSPKRPPPLATLDVEFSRTASGLPWKRSVSAGDLVKLVRGPNRRIFDASTHPEELVSPESAIERLSDKPMHTADPSRRITKLRFRARSETDAAGDPQSPASSGTTGSAYGSRQERALDCWQLGESCRIMNHISPTKHRPISLYGDAFQGKWRSDWSDVEHKQAYRNKYPAERRQPGEPLGPFPQGMSSEQIMRNRGFDKSHGSDRMPMGLMRVGALAMVP